MKSASLKSFALGSCRWRCLRFKDGVGASWEGPTPQCLAVRVLLDVLGDPRQGGDDVAGEERESAENGDRNDGQDDAVLRHRLPLFTLERVKKLQHLIHLPPSDQASLSARQRTTTCERSEWVVGLVGRAVRSNRGELFWQVVEPPRKRRRRGLLPRRQLAQSLP